MAGSIAIFLRGVNVGGSRAFRPAQVARDLAEFGVVNIGAAGTFVARKPGARKTFLTALRTALPFEVEVMVCEEEELLALAGAKPFAKPPAEPDLVRLITTFAEGTKAAPRPLPFHLPMDAGADGEWLVRAIAFEGRFLFSEYRRAPKTVQCLSQLDKICGPKATTRNWNTIQTVIGKLK